MDGLPSEHSLKDKSRMLGEDVDEVAASLGEIVLRDDESIRETLKKNVDVKRNKSNEITLAEKSIEEGVTKSNKGELTEKENLLKEHLESLQCPFSWKWKITKVEHNILSRTIEKMKEIDEDGGFKWRHLILSLVVCYEYYCQNDIDSALIEFRKCEEIIYSSDSKGYFESFFQSTKNALLHVVLACKCYLYFEKGNLEEVEAILKEICREEEMDSPCKAAILGIKGATLMEYGYEGNKTALDYLKEAIKLDKKEGEWYFLLGKCLGRIRRIDHYNDIPALEELKALEEAVKMSRNPSYMIFLAQSYREASFRVFSLNKFNLEAALKERIDNMNKRSTDLYNEALELQGDCSHTNIRCAQGFYKLPYPYKDIEKAKKCCEIALEMAPDNAMVHHVRGSLYDFEEDYENAKKHYKKSGDLGAYGAYMDLVKLEYKLDKSYNPIPQFEKMLERFIETPRREETLCQMGSYYCFIKNDLPTAFKMYWHEVIKANPHSEKLKNHKCCFLFMSQSVDIYLLLFDEGRIALKYSDSKNKENTKLFREMVLVCLDLFPELDGSSPKPRRNMILDESSDIVQSRNRRRGRGRRGVPGQEQRRDRNEGFNRNRNERGASNSFQGRRGRGHNNRVVREQRVDGYARDGSGARDSSDRSRGRSSNSGQRFNRRGSFSNWREDRND